MKVYDSKLRRGRGDKVLRSALMLGGSALAMAALCAPASAQDADGDVVVVTGIRGSLQQSMDIKRNSVGVVDAITAEDIGRFPDTNLAESLQRITGVSIDRVNGEGSQVTVRGFGPGYNLITFNGRTLPTAEVGAVGAQSDFAGGQGRNFDFSNLASEGVAGLQVYKTGNAILPSGGIGATINISTRRPFDTPGTHGTFSIKGDMDQSVEEGDSITPVATGVFSWTNPSATFGVGLFGSYSRRDSGAAIGQVNDWVVRRADGTGAISSSYVRGNGSTQITDGPAANQLYSVPQDSRYDASDITETRKNAQLVVQFRPMDNLTLTGDILYSNTESEEQRYEQTNWFNTPFDVITFNGASPVDSVIFASENDDGNKDMGFEQKFRAQEDEMTSIGFNAEWNVSDHGSFRLDAHSSSAESNPNNPLGHTSTFVSIATPVIATHSVDFSSGFPTQRYTFNDNGVAKGNGKGNSNGVLDVGDLGTQVSRSSAQSQSMDVDEIDLRYSMEFDNSSFNVGANFRSTSVQVDAITTQQDLGSWGIGAPGDVEQYAPGVVETYCLACRFDDFAVGDAQVAFKGDATKLFSILTPIYEAQGKTVSVSESHNHVDEDVSAIYAQYQVNTEFLTRPAQLTGGLRYERTTVESAALQSVPTAVLWTADNDFLVTYGGSTQSVTGSGSYNELLPNIDFKVDVTDDFVVRTSYSKTIGRAPYSNLFASTTVGAPNRPTALGGTTGGNQENPDLLPLESENFDLSFEWYYGNDSFVSVGYFDKTVRNFIGTGVFDKSLFDLRDPSSGAAGTRSGSALSVISSLGVDQSEANLFTLTALIDKYNGNVASAQAEFQANLVNGALPQAYIDSVLIARDVTANSADPLMSFRVSQPINNREGNINGWEIGWQHFFGETGFGVQANYTIVSGDVDADIGSDPNANQFALIGLGDSANFTAIYEKGPWSARLAYNWRDTFLAGTNQGGSRSPVFTEEHGQYDTSITYDLTDNIQLSFEGINLTGENLRQFRRNPTEVIYAYELAPQYLLGARYKF